MAESYIDGIVNPPIDDLLQRVSSKFAMVIYASKRARQINDYYSDLHDGSLFDNIGPLVDSTVDDKPLSISLREIAADKLVLTPGTDVPEPAAVKAAVPAAPVDVAPASAPAAGAPAASAASVADADDGAASTLAAE